MKKQPHITRQTKANLCDAFWQLYTKKPIEKISIKEITDLAGYNRGTFDLYYKDVYDILAQIEDELLDIIQSVVQNAMRNPVFDLSQDMGILVELMNSHSHYASVLMGDNGDPRFITRLKEIILPLLDRYFLPHDRYDEYQRELLSEFYLAGILASVIKWIENPQLTVDEFIAFLAKISSPH